MKRLLILLFLSTTSAFAADDHCSYFKYCGSASATKKSVNTSTSASMNPSNIAKIKGLGFETLFQANNPLGFSMVTGNGKIGGAFISSSLDNSFFGVRSLEIDDVFYERFQERKRYKNKKLSFALGFNLISQDFFDLDLGLSVKRNSEIKTINPGAGFSLRMGFLTLGSYIFKDDVKIDLAGYNSPYNNMPYTIIWNSSTYQESYLVRTFTGGVKIKNFSLDATLIKTRYKFYNEDTQIKIYTLAYSKGKWMFNVGIRKEHSPNLDISKDTNLLYINEDKSFSYLGTQYMVTKNFMLGLGYNTFLLNELSGTFTIFFN